MRRSRRLWSQSKGVWELSRGVHYWMTGVCFPLLYCDPSGHFPKRATEFQWPVIQISSIRWLSCCKVQIILWIWNLWKTFLLFGVSHAFWKLKNYLQEAASRLPFLSINSITISMHRLYWNAIFFLFLNWFPYSSDWMENILTLFGARAGAWFAGARLLKIGRAELIKVT